MAVVANEQLREELLTRQTGLYTNVCFVKSPQEIPADADLIFDLLFENNVERTACLQQFLPRPILVNAVTDTLAAIGQPFIRINAWPGCLKNTISEIAAGPAQQQLLQLVFDQLGWHYQLVPDLVGMVSPRIIGMIINEAYFTLEDNVSTKQEIDIAMRSGTHYPHGPFEWSVLIGLKKIHGLLQQLSKENPLYRVSALLSSEIAMG